MAHLHNPVAQKNGWAVRKKGDMVGRLHTVSPRNRSFYMRIILTHITGREMDLSASDDPSLSEKSYTFAALRCVKTGGETQFHTLLCPIDRAAHRKQ